MSKTEKTKKKSGGGHGKSAGRTDIHLFDPNDVVIIGHDTKDGPEHYLCDVESNSTPLVEASIKFTMIHGVIQPVIGERDGDRTLVGAGRGRTRLLREANIRLVSEGKEPWLLPLMIKRGDEATMYELRLGENSHRREINQFVRAREAQTLIDKGRSRQQVADVLGITAQQLSNNVLPLLGLTPNGVNAVESGKISATAAVQTLGKLPKADQDKRLIELLASGERPTVRAAKNKVREAEGKAPVETPTGKLTKIAAHLNRLCTEPGDQSAHLSRVPKDELVATLVAIRAIVEGRTETR